MPRLLWTGSVILLGVAACGGDTTAVLAPVSTPVLALRPAPNASSVSRRDTVMLQLGVSMDSASCASRFHLQMGDSTGAMVPGHFAYGDAYRRMMFVPDSMLQAGSTYFVHVQDGMMSGGTMMGGGGMGSGMQSGTPMMLDQPPAGAMRLSDGMGWTFTTGAN
jgi:Big-like domain-containing protein